MRRGAACAAAFAALLGACAGTPPAPTGLMDVAERPAERTLLAGIRSYEDAQYGPAEEQLRSALVAGLASPKDRAAAHKYLAFIACTSERAAECEAEFRQARAADPGFALSRSEAGHPVWAPVYRRIAP
jgi:Tfp pilus assembly protein PilF